MITAGAIIAAHFITVRHDYYVISTSLILTVTEEISSITSIIMDKTEGHIG